MAVLCVNVSMKCKYETMKTKVTEQGVLIPKQWLKYVDEVEIRFDHEIILVIPIRATVSKITRHLSDTSPTSSSPSITSIHDPIFSLGKHPIDDELKDVSINHDKYIYVNYYNVY
jgi:hypothetical protein